MRMGVFNEVQHKVQKAYTTSLGCVTGWTQAILAVWINGTLRFHEFKKDVTMDKLLRFQNGEIGDEDKGGDDSGRKNWSEHQQWSRMCQSQQNHWNQNMLERNATLVLSGFYSAQKMCLQSKVCVRTNIFWKVNIKFIDLINKMKCRKNRHYWLIDWTLQFWFC